MEKCHNAHVNQAPTAFLVLRNSLWSIANTQAPIFTMECRYCIDRSHVFSYPIYLPYEATLPVPLPAKPNDEQATLEPYEAPVFPSLQGSIPSLQSTVPSV